eukprot:GFYU01003584.1.p1 GENE.GFYU01003584.1~~GFYU01003584.1.p1  ORF type:complete len:414 (+),score=68.70 GFYU01003584.1:199-1440(+)
MSVQEEKLATRPKRCNDDWMGVLTSPYSVACVCFATVGIVPWILVNAIFAQMPIYYVTIDDQFKTKIASWLSLAVQCANVVPFLFVGAGLFNYWSLVKSVASVLVLAAVTSVGLGLLWDVQVDIEGMGVNLYLLVGTVFAGVVGGMGNVTFWAFASMYRDTMMTALSVGFGASGLLPNLLALAQNAGPDARFSANVFFFIHAILVAAAICAFVVLTRTTIGVGAEKVTIEVEGDAELLLPKPTHSDTTPVGLLRNPLIWIQFSIAFMSFFSTGLSTYWVAGDENASATLLWLNLCSPIGGISGRILAGWAQSLNSLYLAILQFLLFAYLLGVAFGGTASPFSLGSVVLVAISTSFQFVFGLNNTRIFKQGSDGQQKDAAEQVSRVLGVVEQAGAFTGTLVCFIMTTCSAFTTE